MMNAKKRKLHISAFCTLRSAFARSFRNPNSAIRNEKGQAIVEYAIVFPLQLIMVLAIIQLAQIFVAQQVIEYGAFCAARAAVVYPDDDDAAKRAAIIPISRITGTGGITDVSLQIEIPGWGPLGSTPNNPNPKYATAADEKTELVIDHTTMDGAPVVDVELEHWYELQVPIGDVIAYKLGDIFLSAEDLDRTTYGTPHIRLRANCVLAQPWED